MFINTKYTTNPTDSFVTSPSHIKPYKFKTKNDQFLMNLKTNKHPKQVCVVIYLRPRNSGRGKNSFQCCSTEALCFRKIKINQNQK